MITCSDDQSLGAIGRDGDAGRRERGAVVVAQHGRHAGDELHGVVKVVFSLAGKADNKVGRQADIRSDRPQFGDFVAVFLLNVTAFHGRENTVAAALHLATRPQLY